MSATPSLQPELCKTPLKVLIAVSVAMSRRLPSNCNLLMLRVCQSEIGRIIVYRWQAVNPDGIVLAERETAIFLNPSAMTR
jgi:hypothetical protein